MNALRPVLLAVATMFPVATHVAAQQTRELPRTLADTLTQLEIKSWDAWKARDSSFYRTFLSDDHVELGWSGRSSKAEVSDYALRRQADSKSGVGELSVR